jgi:hypothetical protein
VRPLGVFSRVANLYASSKAARCSATSLVLWTICLGTACRLLVAATVPDSVTAKPITLPPLGTCIELFRSSTALILDRLGGLKLTASDTVLAGQNAIHFDIRGNDLAHVPFHRLAVRRNRRGVRRASLNVSPLFAISLGAWVQPDGPLLFACLPPASVLSALPITKDSSAHCCFGRKLGFGSGLPCYRNIMQCSCRLESCCLR